MKRVLVTGATGFVGSHVVEALGERGDVEIIAACRDRSKLPDVAAGEVVEGDLRDESYVKRLVEGVGAVCHCAAWTALYGYAERSDALFLQPSLRLVQAAREQGVGHFVFISTTSAAAPDALAYPFAWLMEKLDPVVTWDPLVTRSIVHLLEETGADNTRAQSVLGYRPRYHWKDAVDAQLEEMARRQKVPMRMHVPAS